MKFPTLVLAVGAAVLLIAVAIGERMGDRVVGQATEHTLQSIGPVSVSPSPNASPRSYGPDWKRTQALSAAGDPRFPDPRVPPQPLPTLAPTPTPRPKPLPTATPYQNNVPIWRQSPMPSAGPSQAPTAPSSGVPSSAEPSETPAVPPTPPS